MYESPSSSSLSSEDGHADGRASLRIVVHAGQPPPVSDAAVEAAVEVAIDARQRRDWDILAALNTDLGRLPAVYEVDAPVDWLRHPRPLSRRRCRLLATSA